MEKHGATSAGPPEAEQPPPASSRLLAGAAALLLLGGGTAAMVLVGLQLVGLSGPGAAAPPPAVPAPAPTAAAPSRRYGAPGILDDMLAACARTRAGLEALAAESLPPDAAWDRTKALTSAHMRQMLDLGRRMDALPAGTRQAHAGSAEGAAQFERVNAELQAIKRLAFAITEGTPSALRDFGEMPREAAEALLNNQPP